MFSLIVVLVSVVLAVLVTLAAVYYGGNAYLRASNDAQVSALMAQGNQIRGAASVYTANQGSPPSSINDLVTDNYLRQAPPNWSITTSGEVVLYTQVSGTSLCQKFNEKYDGYTANTPVPACTSVNSSEPVCCD